MHCLHAAAYVGLRFAAAWLAFGLTLTAMVKISCFSCLWLSPTRPLLCVAMRVLTLSNHGPKLAAVQLCVGHSVAGCGFGPTSDLTMMKAETSNAQRSESVQIARPHVGIVQN